MFIVHQDTRFLSLIQVSSCWQKKKDSSFKLTDLNGIIILVLILIDINIINKNLEIEAVKREG